MNFAVPAEIGDSAERDDGESAVDEWRAQVEEIGAAMPGVDAQRETVLERMLDDVGKLLAAGSDPGPEPVSQDVWDSYRLRRLRTVFGKGSAEMLALGDWIKRHRERRSMLFGLLVDALVSEPRPDFQGADTAGRYRAHWIDALDDLLTACGELADVIKLRVDKREAHGPNGDPGVYLELALGKRAQLSALLAFNAALANAHTADALAQRELLRAAFKSGPVTSTTSVDRIEPDNAGAADLERAFGDVVAREVGEVLEAPGTSPDAPATATEDA